MSATLLLLADGRLPAGGYAHSGGIEAAVAAGIVRDAGTLAGFLHARLQTSGLNAAALAVLAFEGNPGVDATADARTPSPAQRRTSRDQGRALIRLARRTWPSEAYDGLGPAPHHAVALGAVARVAGLDAHAAALTVAWSSVSGPASAAVRLLGLDPVEVTALQARLSTLVDGVALEATKHPERCPGSPLLDVLAEAHAASTTPLFTS